MRDGFKEKIVGFADMPLREAYDKLGKGKFEDRRLYKALNLAFDELKKNPYAGIQVQRHLWPRIYVIKHGITNLWKYDMQDGWRLVYTVTVKEVQIVSIVLEWFDSHKKYEKRFGYKKK
jgi:Txe/YoeB family toxin of Txe-Axe toxin-antitoxin module